MEVILVRDITKMEEVMKFERKMEEDDLTMKIKEDGMTLMRQWKTSILLFQGIDMTIMKS